MRQRLYHLLVNRQPGIRVRYHKMHDGAIGWKKVFSWIYLLWLNFCYYVLFCRFLGKQPEMRIYEEKNIPITESESVLAAREHLSIEACVDKLKTYDVVSFDIFDTLIFRPFSEPTDLFFFLGAELDILDFKRIRMEMEHKAREECMKKNGHTEITLRDIWAKIESEVGISAEEGCCLEQRLEEQFCYANPYMLEVFRRLKQQGKQIIVVSDMYLPESFLRKLLEKNGYEGIDKIYISCEHGKNKASGTLFEVVRGEYAEKMSIIHVGDNKTSDIAMAKQHGFETLYYPNCSQNASQYRASDMSPVIGSAYRGIVNTYLYQGIGRYSMPYEYGFIYGGLFVLGYCNFIHEYCKNNSIDKILFLSRDGDILMQAYDRLYPEDSFVYAYWSRLAATKLMAGNNRYDYFRRFLYHKVNQGRTVENVLQAMELEALLVGLPEDIKASDTLTERNVERVKCYIEQQWGQVQQIYGIQNQAAKTYYAELLQNCDRVCAVDIGWAGSGAVSLDYLVRHVWKLPCEVTGIVAGTNTLHNAEPDTSEIHLQTGKLVSYLYSTRENRDLLKKHNPNRNYNVYWELLLSSPTKQFQGFAFDEEGKVTLSFGNKDANQEGIQEIQCGILDFVEEYQKHFKAFPYMYRISGRDAYAPMLVAASHEEAYLKSIESQFSFKIAVGD